MFAGDGKREGGGERWRGGGEEWELVDGKIFKQAFPLLTTLLKSLS